jgi:hypothetical protein
VEGRAAERARGTLEHLEPGEQRRFWIELHVLVGGEVEVFADRIGCRKRV